MSTYWGYRCTSHDPPLDSETWLNHGEDELERGLRDRDAIVRAVAHVEEFFDPFDAPAWWYWLAKHPRCAVVVVNEYNRTLAEHRALLCWSPRLSQPAFPRFPW